MITNFSLLTAETVPSTYSWDKGIPLSGSNTTIIPIDITTVSITGTAPGVKVRFKNNSVTDSGFTNRQYFWDFGDYYNISTNFLALTCPTDVEHTYIMPGEYTVTLYHIQSRIRQDFDFSTNDTYCKGKYDIRWFWDNTIPLSITWDQTKCTGQYSKWWDNELACFAKYCKFWNWYDLQSASLSGLNPVTWQETYSVGGTLPKRWSFEPNDTVCKTNQDATFIDTVETNIQTYITTGVVKIIEIEPIANLYCLTQPITGYSPFTVQITPRGTIPGSYAIDKIVWDPGDGSSFKTVWRYKLSNDSNFTYTGTFSADPSDPRNYDLIHTYKRNLNNYSVFYPSITAYSANTNKANSCSITLGPVSLSSTSSQIHILKSKNTNTSNLYALQFNNKITFVTTQSANSIQPEIKLNLPSNTVKNTNFPSIVYRGNAENVFPTVFYPQC